MFRQQMLEKYGAETPMHCESIKAQAKQTLQARYGSHAFLATEAYRAKMLLLHNAPHPMQSTAVVEQCRNTSMMRYGRPNYAQNHIGDNTWNMLQQSTKFADAFKGHSFTSFANQHNLSDVCVASYATKYGLTSSHVASSPEIEISEFLTANAIKHERGNRTIIKPKELDFFLPEHNLAIEFNGLYWHSSKFKDIEYHATKTSLCNDQGVQLLHIFEDEWKTRKELLKKCILLLCEKTTNVVSAADLRIDQCEECDIAKFLADNHLNPQTVVGTHYVKVTQNDKLVAAAVLGQRGDNIDVVQFSSDHQASYPGMISKVVSFLGKAFHCKTVTVKVDLRLSTGKLFSDNGWQCTHISPPSHEIVVAGQRQRNPSSCHSPKLHIYDAGTAHFSIEVNAS
jgi:very-short-patch-repair endonuclease